MAQAELLTDLNEGLVESTSGIKGFWNSIKRWPLVSIVVLALLLITAAFANFIGPNDPIRSIPDNTTLAPIWYEAQLVSVQDLPIVVAIDGVTGVQSIASAAAQYNVIIPDEEVGDKSKVRSAFNEQAGVRAVVMEVATIMEVRDIARWPGRALDARRSQHNRRRG